MGGNPLVTDPTILRAVVTMEALGRVKNADLAREFETIIDVVTYKRKSLNTGRIYTNVANCKLDIIKKVIAGESVKDLCGKYARSTVWRYKKELLRGEIIVPEMNGALVLNPEKLPGLSSFRLIQGFRTKVPK